VVASVEAMSSANLGCRSYMLFDAAPNGAICGWVTGGYKDFAPTETDTRIHLCVLGPERRSWSSEAKSYRAVGDCAFGSCRHAIKGAAADNAVWAEGAV
jgi:hypothetical protein